MTLGKRSLQSKSNVISIFSFMVYPQCLQSYQRQFSLFRSIWVNANAFNVDSQKLLSTSALSLLSNENKLTQSSASDSIKSKELSILGYMDH